MPNLEIACFNASSALTANAHGASRIELCQDASVGGTTPSLSVLQHVKENVKIPVYVMIRPRGGDFCYSAEEITQMRDDMGRLGDLADGFVFGVLKKDGEVDGERNMELVELARRKPCTFHRAFDEARHPLRALEEVARCGFANVLTSGGASSAPAGAEMLGRLVGRGRELGVNVMPGGGVRSGNVGELVKCTGAEWYHSSAVTEGGEMASEEEVKMLRCVLDGACAV